MTQDSKTMIFLSRICDILLLNFLFILTSLPIITLGASITALYSVNLKMVYNEESYISRDYFRAFRKNFKIATPTFLFFLIFIALMGVNIWISLRAEGSFYIVLRTLASIFLFCLLICAKYYFPILARFVFTSKQVWIHIPHMITTHIGYFLFLVILNIPVIILIMHSVYTAIFVLFFGCICGFALFTYIECFLFRSIFKDYEHS